MLALKKTRQKCQKHGPQKCLDNCGAASTAKLMITIDDEILTLNAAYSGVLTLSEAAERMRITEDEISAMMEGFFWSTQPQNKAATDDMCNEIMNPKVFESLFLEYIKLTNTNEFSSSLKSRITSMLDEMLSTFPFETFPELCSTHFDWDDATRFVLDYINKDIIMDIVKKLRDEFWKIYSHRMCVIRDVMTMKSKYYGALEVADKRIEDMRNEILEIYTVPIEESMMHVMRFMHGVPDAP
jgi:hypothetical protein